MHLSRAALRKGGPWAALVVAVWSLQVWAIWGSDFTMEVTVLQGVFVAVFVVVILLIAQARIDEGV